MSELENSDKSSYNLKLYVEPTVMYIKSEPFQEIDEFGKLDLFNTVEQSEPEEKDTFFEATVKDKNHLVEVWVPGIPRDGNVSGSSDINEAEKCEESVGFVTKIKEELKDISFEEDPVRLLKDDLSHHNSSFDSNSSHRTGKCREGKLTSDRSYIGNCQVLLPVKTEVKTEKFDYVEKGHNLKVNGTTDTSKLCDQNQGDSKPLSLKEVSFEGSNNSENIKSSIHQCSHCSYNSSSLSKYILHLRCFHDRKFLCDYCQRGFKTNSNLHMHLVSHRTKRSYVCEICQKSFKTSGKLKIHHITHSVERKFVCDICEKRYKTKIILKYHKELHSDRRNFVCSICQKGFKTRMFLRSHLLTHSDERKFSCGICQKAFKSAGAVKKHLIVHRVDRNFICDVCQKSFKRNVEVKQHRLIHSEELKCICDICEKGFRTVGSLNSHKKIHGDKKNFICDICGKGCITFGVLTQHKKIHCPDKNFACPMCQKRFTTSVLLNVHKKRHFVDRSIICYHCGERFRRKSQLCKHLMVHCSKKKL